MSKIIALFTDFGSEGPYLGQLEAVIYQQTDNIRIINLLSDAPSAKPRRAGYLLAALAKTFTLPTVFLAIVDPGVGGPRIPVVLLADGHYFVGPDNGLLNTIAVQSQQCQWWQISWQPETLSNSFHGRDLFAPVAAAIINGNIEQYCTAIEPLESISDWPTDLAEIIYFDHYGNALTGLRVNAAISAYSLLVNGHLIAPAPTFCQVAIGTAFWYENSCGLVEIAVNQGEAKTVLQLTCGLPISFVEGALK